MKFVVVLFTLNLIRKSSRRVLVSHPPNPHIKHCRSELSQFSFVFQQYNELDFVKSQGITSEMSDNEKSFGSLSPINQTPPKTHSTSKNDWSCESMKSIYNSTPECSLSNYLTTSSNSVNILDETKEKSSMENDMAMDMDMTMFSMTDDEKQLSYVRTPSRRRHRYSSRKNLSHSFSCLDDVDEAIQPVTDGNILSKTDSGFNETDDKTSNDSKWTAMQPIQSINDNMDVDAASPRGNPATNF